MFGDKKIKIKDSERSLISETVSIEGTINSSGAIDIAGLVKGPVISKELIVRDTGSITGTIEGDHVEIHGHLDGKVSAQNIVIGATGTVKGDIEFETTELRMGQISMVILKKPIPLNQNSQETSYLRKKIKKALVLRTDQTSLINESPNLLTTIFQIIAI